MSTFKRVAVLGAGVMGTGIAAHLANAGIESLLFDMKQEWSAGALAKLPKAKPSLLYRESDIRLIKACNYEEHGELLGTCDWIIEVVTERLDIKQKVFETVAKHRKPGTIVSSNTSGIPLAAMAATMPEEMRRHFAITHFFNPVRYMRLLEIVGGADTLPAVTRDLAAFGERVLGKGIVHAKDTPNFVANRVGTFGMGSVFRHMARLNLDVETVDAIFGSAMGRPKSAVFRTADVVGLDTLSHVFGTVYEKCPDDEERSAFVVPDYLTSLIASGRTGAKTGAGFYKKVGKDILALDLNTLEYRPQGKPRFDSLGKAKKAEKLGDKLKAICYGDDLAAQAGWAVTADTLIYSANRIPEIADDVYAIDNAMRWGFGWDQGPFETWDLLGVAESVAKMEAEGRTVPAWVKQMLDAGRTSFYARDGEGRLTMWKNGAAVPVPRSEGHLFLADVKAKGKPAIERNPSATLLDLGDGVLGLEFHSKMNSLDDLIFSTYEKALDKLDAGEFEALVVGNQAGNAFSAGANVLMILMAAMQKDWASIDTAIQRLQNLLMRAKYSKRPVVTAPYALTLGGGAETAMQSTATVAGGELYMGLVEAGVGLIPGGGGCKEMIVRALGDIPLDINYDPNPFVQKVFERIGMAKVSTSAGEARAMGFLRASDKIVLDIDRLLGDAKQMALGLAKSGYVPADERVVKLPGKSGLAAIELFLYQMQEGGMATAHDVTVGKQLAKVLTGGDLPYGATRTERQLLDLEREAFLSLCGEEKSQARMQAMLTTGKPLRN